VNLSQIWKTTLGALQVQTTRQEYDAWLRETELLELESGMATIGTSTSSVKDGLENRLLVPVRNALTRVVGYPVKVRVMITNGTTRREIGTASGIMLDEKESLPAPEAGPQRDSAAAPATAERAVQLDLNSALRTGMLNPKYTFDRFIVGSSNRMAHAVCKSIAETPGRKYNPLFLYGGVGLGKTHLLHAIGNEVLDRNPDINVLYVSSEKFTNDLINAIRRQQTEEFRNQYRSIDVLLIDDIQFIAGKDATQEEFFHTFNALHSASRHIVISSDRPPKAIMTLEDRLRSRFEWGLTVDIQQPDYETRTAILRTKGEQLSLAVPDDVIAFLATKIQSNIRELEGSLNRVAAFADLNKRPITIETATMALAELLGSQRKRRVTSDTILQIVAEHYNVDLEQLRARGRSRNIVVPRQVAMYLLREETDSSLVDIGKLLGGRDHTTVMYGCDKIAEDMTTDSRLRSEVMSLRERLQTF
jgi:chromosomal replication initiator protein